jgi:hypothetical protein
LSLFPLLHAAPPRPRGNLLEQIEALATRPLELTRFREEKWVLLEAKANLEGKIKPWHISASRIQVKTPIEAFDLFFPEPILRHLTGLVNQAIELKGKGKKHIGIGKFKAAMGMRILIENIRSRENNTVRKCLKVMRKEQKGLPFGVVAYEYIMSCLTCSAEDVENLGAIFSRNWAEHWRTEDMAHGAVDETIFNYGPLMDNRLRSEVRMEMKEVLKEFRNQFTRWVYEYVGPRRVKKETGSKKLLLRETSTTNFQIPSDFQRKPG